jgi:putative peptidoglycan lipid II flippase
MSFVRSAGLISACTLLSRILGFARDAIASYFFGTSKVWDAFALAFRIPNLFRRLFGEGALTSAFLPAFVERFDGGRPQEAAALLRKLSTALALFLGLGIAAGIGFTYALPRMFPGDEKVALEAPLLRIMLPFLGFICVAAIYGAALNGTRHYLAPALAPVLVNIAWIATLFIWPANVEAVAWSVVAGGVITLGVLLPPLWKRGMSIRPDLDLKDPALRGVGRTFLPIVLGLAPAQINEVVGSLIAQHAIPGTGAVSAVYYGNQLTQLPLALIGTALATAVFPLLSSPKEDFGQVFRQAMRLTFFLALPATAGLIALARPIVALLFERGAFDAASTERVAAVVTWYSAGLWCYCANQIQARAFYARKDSVTPARVGCAMVLLNLGLTIALVGPLRETGIAIANSVTGLATFLTLNALLRRRVPGLSLATVDLAKCAGASLVMAAAAWGLARWLTLSIEGATLGPKLIRALVPVAAGGAVYFLLARLLRVDEARRLLRRRRDDPR